MMQRPDIPEFVVSALHAVEEQLPADCFEPDTVLTFVHLFGYDDACSWLEEHRSMYFVALGQAFPHEEHINLG
jgi:hypothetical protein